MTPQQLKNSILQRAIEGRLVPQKAEEGTAKELLQKIQAEKAQLIAEKKIKKTKALPPISDEEIPFDIPDSWEWARLGEIGGLERGTGLKRSEMSDTGMPCIRYGELYTTYHTRFSKTISHTTEEVFECCHKVNNGEILMTLTGENKQDIAMALAYDGDEEIAMGGDMTKWFAHGMNSLYLTYLLNSPYCRTCKQALATGNIIVHISNDKLSRIPLPIPPLAEQHRIVAKIEELLPLIDKYDKAYTKLMKFNVRFPEDMKKSILQYAIEGKLVEQRKEEGTADALLQQIQAEKKRLIEEKKIKKTKPLPQITEDEIPFDIPVGWKWVRLGEIGDWGSGATPKRHHPEYYGGDIPWLKTGDLNDGYVSEIPESITQEGFDNSSVRLNPVGSVLMAMYGATIGKLGILTIPATTNQACCACVPFADLNPKYLFYYLMSQRNNFIKMGEGGAQPNISKEKIVNYVFPLPSLAEQHRIVEKIEELLPLCEQLIK